MKIEVGHQPRRSVRRLVTTSVAAALATVGLVATSGATAHAADAPAPSLSWKISTYAATEGGAGQLADHTFTGGASETARVVTFPDGVGSVDAGTGIGSVTYAGSVSMSAHSAYTVTIANPTVAVDAAGKGTISADVSWAVAAAGTTPASAGGPSRVNLTTFATTGSGEDWTTADGLSTLTKTPNWADVQPTFTDATAAADAGYTTAGRPLAGKSWDPAFIAFLKPSGTGAFFYQTSAANDNKAPAQFTATALAPSTTVTTTSTTPAGGVTLSVSGTGFSKAAPESGLNNGIYVGVAPTGERPDVSDPANTGAFASAAWVQNSEIGTDGTFTTSLTVPTAKLDPTKAYSVYTWRAHNYATSSQDTGTAFDVDFDALAKTLPTVALAGPATAVYGAGSTVTATVSGKPDSGTVTLTGAGTALKATPTDGVATFTLPTTLAAADYSLVASYAGNDDLLAATSAARAFKVTIAKVTIKRGNTTKPTTRKAGSTTVYLTSTPGTVVNGQVTITFKKKGAKTKTKTAYVTTGSRAVTVPKLAKGTWTVSVKYLGTSSFARTATAKTGTFTVTR